MASKMISNIYKIFFRGKPVDTFQRKGSGLGSSRTNSFALQTNATYSTLALPANSKRKYLLVQNLSGASIYLNIGSPASQTPLKGIEIFTNGNYEPAVAPTDSIHILGTSGVQDVSFFEGI